MRYTVHIKKHSMLDKVMFWVKGRRGFYLYKNRFVRRNGVLVCDNVVNLLPLLSNSQCEVEAFGLLVTPDIKEINEYN